MSEQKVAPGWFKRAIAEPFEDRVVDVDHIPIHYLYWEKGEDAAEKPGIILVHGNGAHAHWWTFIAPFFLNDYRVVAIDLAGAGDSGCSEKYSPEGFARQVIDVCEDAGFGSDTVVIGHSFGGFITLKTGLI